MEKYNNRPNRQDLINNADMSQLINRINTLGVSHTARMYKCISEDVINHLVNMGIKEVMIPNVKFEENEILYMYKEKGVLFISKRIEKADPTKKRSPHLHFEKVDVSKVEDERLSVSKSEVLRLLEKHSIEKTAMLLNIYEHRVASFAGIQVEDED